jgi:hypothetical protein
VQITPSRTRRNSRRLSGRTRPRHRSVVNFEVDEVIAPAITQYISNPTSRSVQLSCLSLCCCCYTAAVCCISFVLTRPLFYNCFGLADPLACLHRSDNRAHLNRNWCSELFGLFFSGDLLSTLSFGTSANSSCAKPALLLHWLIVEISLGLKDWETHRLIEVLPVIWKEF